MKALWLALVIALAPEVWLPRPPAGLDLYMPVPEANPLTREKVELGRRLFSDTRLSLDQTLACVSCHDPKRAFSDGRIVARGLRAAAGARHTPAIINRGYGASFFWNGRATSLEQQALEPILNPKELGLSVVELERRLGMKVDDVTNALASYVRTIRSGSSRFDRYSDGHTRALNALERTGLELFRGKGHCNACHIGPNFTDERFHNTGVAWRASAGQGGYLDEGRFTVSKDPRDRGAFKVPTLREVARTAPYMHDGSLATLEEVVEFYSGGGRPNPALDAEIRQLSLTPAEKHALVLFLKSLSGTIREGTAL